MATDPIDLVKAQVGLRLSEIRDAAPSLSPLDLYARMDAIRQLAAEHGLAALEHMAAALDSRSPADCATILAALAVRLH